MAMSLSYRPSKVVEYGGIKIERTHSQNLSLLVRQGANRPVKELPIFEVLNISIHLDPLSGGASAGQSSLGPGGPHESCLGLVATTHSMRWEKTCKFDYDQVMVRILTVCAGNICRSPYAELFLQSELDRISPESFTIRSAGSHALVGHHMDERSSMKLREIGVPSDGFAARQLNEQIANNNDLILALTDELRKYIVEMSPRLLKRTYTVLEFAAVLEEVSAMPNFQLPTGNDESTVDERWTTLLKAAQRARHAARIKTLGKLDVIDPYRQTDQVYEQMVNELLPALKTIVSFESFHTTQN